MNDSNHFTAFTIKANGGKLRELVTEITVKQAKILREKFNLSESASIVKGIWDTGATGSCISSALALKLKLVPISRTTVHGVNSSHDVNVYMCDFYLPNKVIIERVVVTEAKNLGNYDVLIGMDIITIGDFCLTNSEGNTVFSVRFPPSQKYIDFVEDWIKLNQK